MRAIKGAAIAVFALLAGLGSAQARRGRKRRRRRSPRADPARPRRRLDGAPSTAPALTKADVDLWLDGYMPYALRTGDIPGAVVTVVKDGQILTTRGFGYADRDKRTPVDPDKTLFRPGSISKLFTWTAVMQQVEAGKIDLDADVNTYLDFKIPARNGKPVTTRQLMTHTAGFEEVVKALIFYDKPEPQLGDYLKKHVPKRIFDAGVTPAYSNYATALAAYIVERVSGEKFNDYLDRHVMGPLKMANTTFRQPLPANLVGRTPRLRQARQAVEGLRDRRSGPGRRGLVDRRRHGPVHDRPPAGRRAGRPAHPVGRDGPPHALQPHRTRSTRAR
jgi:CubicO group peptidase (beta-lactamase class C family)